MKKYCILIPAYNNQAGLDVTIASLPSDMAGEFDIIIYDDGSAVPIKKTSRTPYSIKIFREGSNKGVGYGLNFLLEYAKNNHYEYAFRIDADDVVINNRFSLQINYMNNNLECAVLGGGMSAMDSNYNIIRDYIPPIDSVEIKKGFQMGYPIFHPTVVLRLSFFRKNNLNYSKKYVASQDYELFYKIFAADNKSVSNLGDVVIGYVRNENSVGIKRARLQAFLTLKVRLINNSLFDLHFWRGVFSPLLWLRIISPKLFYYIFNNKK